MMKNEVQNAKNNNLQARPNWGSLIKFDKSNKLLQDIEQSKITHEVIDNTKLLIRRKPD